MAAFGQVVCILVIDLLLLPGFVLLRIMPGPPISLPDEGHTFDVEDHLWRVLEVLERQVR